MTRHPGDTRHLIELADLKPGARVLDLGAGDGDGVRLLRSLGFEAYGIDRKAAPDVALRRPASTARQRRTWTRETSCTPALRTRASTP